ncbi:TonB-dependent receptor [Chitinophaga sp. MD30]|uniref:SusC/RagA family TonB-linked outer membrane protein n=1 Tax=Chitinophaga sp. MD30 TaxID=2033437 RepID=UPI000BB00CE1|nr:TonB-dependent receptor [Chitinophaga sp. MD30]ASZ09765.1 SusC/RagA family TonB-linked outer membrane protein [Chitinophaga sp. MD30]
MKRLLSSKVRWILLYLLTQLTVANAQSIVVKGKVTAAKEGIPLTGVTVAVKGGKTGTQTDGQGQFQLNVTDRNAVLLFTYIGFIAKEEALNGRASVIITLEEDNRKLDEVVVVGYGQQKRKDVTGAVSSINSADLLKTPAPRADQLLQGKMPGVQVMNNTGRPGGPPRINIRGSNSVNGSNDPLIVIDGVIGGDFNDVNPGDIASVDVLKDASATAIYGSRGANGVIMITTKRGKAGKTRVSYNNYFTVQQVAKKLDLLNGAEFYQMRQNLLAFYKSKNMPAAVALEKELSQVDRSINTDWQDEVFRQGFQMNHELSIAGGSEKTRFMFSAGYMKQKGVIDGSDFQRASARFNLDHELSNKIRIGINLALAKTGENRVAENQAGGSEGGDVIQNANKFDPTLPVYAADGDYIRPRNSGSQLENPRAMLNERTRKYFGTRLTANVFGDYAVTSWLNFRSSFTYDYADDLNKFFTSGKLLAEKNSGYAEAQTNKYNHWIIENTLTFNKQFGDHRLTALGGFTAEEETVYDFSASGRGLSTEALEYNGLNLAATPAINSGSGRNTLASFLGRINYSFKDRYLLTLSGRSDGASKFAKNNKWAFFPSAALAWRMSEEDFIRSIPTINNLKLRVSYGQSGSQAISRYQSLARITTGARMYSYGNTEVVGAQNGSVANPNLTWETTAQLNAGIDFSILSDRISGAIDYYHKKTTNLLYSKPVPTYTGYTSVLSNSGTVINKGWEFELNTRNLTGAFTWNTNINFSANKNRVLALGDLKEIYQNGSGNALGDGFKRTGVLRIGHSIGEFYGYVFDGIYQHDKEVQALPFPGAKPGSIKYKDVNGDGQIIPDDRTVIGLGVPKFTYGFTNDFAYRNFDLSVFFQGSYGNDILNMNRIKLERAGYEENSLRTVLNYWHGEGTSNTIQALDEPTGEMSSRFIEDGSYLRLKNIMLGYSLPASLLKRWGIQHLRIYVSGQNLLTFTKYTGYDPEVNSRSGDGALFWGYDLGSYPGIKSYTAGLNVTF